jgi:hypothetical protein
MKILLFTRNMDKMINEAGPPCWVSCKPLPRSRERRREPLSLLLLSWKKRFCCRASWSSLGVGSGKSVWSG